MQAIQTHYLPVTNFKGSRIKASCAGGSVIISYPYELSGQAVHRAAAEALVKKMGWDDPHYGTGLLGGCLPNGDYCFVFNNAWAKE